MNFLGLLMALMTMIMTTMTTLIIIAPPGALAPAPTGEWQDEANCQILKHTQVDKFASEATGQRTAPERSTARQQDRTGSEGCARHASLMPTQSQPKPTGVSECKWSGVRLGDVEADDLSRCVDAPLGLRRFQ